MVYARCVVKEILRLRTPPPMVPNQAQRDFELAPGMVVPKGAIVIPSTWNVCLQGASEHVALRNARAWPRLLL